MDNSVLQHPEVLGNYQIEIIGDAVEHQSTQIRRMVAKQILKRDILIFFPQNCHDLMRAAVELEDLRLSLLSFLAYFAAEFRGATEPYSAEGITFSALVHLVRIEKDLLAYGWLPEQIRALGLSINPGEELAWPITGDFVAIKDREGNSRRFFRLS
jgi:hypothetical protein